MKFAFSTCAFKLLSLKDTMATIANGGYRAVELMADRPHAFPEDFKASRITEFSQCLDDKKMIVVNLNSSVVNALGDGIHPTWIEEDWKERELRIRYTLDCLRLAAALGIPSVTTGGGGPIPESMNQREAWRLFVANMHRVLPLAKKLGVRLLVQPDPDSLIRTSDQVAALIEELDGLEALGVDFDPGHAWCAGEDPCEAFEKVHKHVVHVHLSDVQSDRKHRHVQLGDGVLDLPSFLHCVERSGYDGYLTVHVSPTEREEEEIVTASVNYLKKNGFWPE